MKPRRRFFYPPQYKTPKKPYICQMKQKILSISRQSFRDLQEANCIYVDKTQHIYNLCTTSKRYFLSRPRRFGKSLLLSTMHELFLGSQELFKETWIVDKWDWAQKNPVIHMSFSIIDYEEESLEIALRAYLLDLFQTYQLDSKGKKSIKFLFFELIKQLSQ